MGVSDWISSLYDSVTDAAASLAPNDVYAEAAEKDAPEEEQEGEEKEVSFDFFLEYIGLGWMVVGEMELMCSMLTFSRCRMRRTTPRKKRKRRRRNLRIPSQGWKRVSRCFLF